MIDFNQILVCILIIFIGSSFLLKFRLNNLLQLSLSWFAGSSAIVIFYVFLTIFSININLKNITLIYLIFFFTVFIFFHKLIISKIYLKNFINNLVYGFVFFLIISFFLKNNLVTSPDTLHYFSTSRVFHQIINQRFADVILLEWIFDARLIFLVAINNFSFLLNQDLFNLFIPVSSLFFVIILYFYFDKLIDFEDKKYKYFLILSILLLLFSNHVFFLHSFYFHTNLLTSIYFTFAIICICIYLERKEFSFLLLSFFCLSLTCLIRKEMFVFSLIPIIYLNIQNIPLVFFDRLKLLLIFLTGFSYHIWKFFWMHKDAKFKFNFFLDSHGGSSIEFISTFCLILILILVPMLTFLKTKFRWILTYVIAGITIIILYFFKPNDTMQTFSSLLNLIFFKGGWGTIWILIILNLLIITIGLISNKRLEKINYFKVFEITSSITFLYFTILYFFLFRIILYILYDSPQDNGFWSSGNRVMLHIYPTCLILIVYSLRQIYKKN